MTIPPPPKPWRKPDPAHDPVAETPRLVIRPYRAEDAPALFRVGHESGAQLLPWLPWAAEPHEDVASALTLIHHFTKRASLVEAADFVLGIFDRATGDLIGGTGFHRIDLPEHCGELGYWIHGARQREGLCTEAMRALVTAGFTDWGFRRLKICCAAPNTGSVTVIERIGFRLEAREHAERYIPGHGYVDSLTFALLREEWDPVAGCGPGGTFA